jgi:uncharacterized protein
MTDPCGSVAGRMNDGPGTIAQRALGTERRAWISGRLGPLLGARKHAITSSAVSIAVRDGVTLKGTLRCPTDAGPHPGIVMANGYGPIIEPELDNRVTLLAQEGYVVLCATLRGLPPSEGRRGLYERFGTDACDLIEWLARQPVCNGRVGMVGSSLLGLVQYLAAKDAPSSLEVILPDDAGSDNYWYLWHPGGMSAGPGRAARQSVSGAEDEFALAVAHPNYDSFWRERTVQASDLEAIARRGIAVFLTSGWDSYLLGSTKGYEWLKAGNPGPKLKMFIGSGGHGAFMSPEGSLSGVPVLPFSGFEYCIMWLDRWLKDARNGVDEEPPVLIYVQGPNEWRFEHDWPLQDERRVRLYLRDEQSGTGAGWNDGVLSALLPGSDAEAAYDYSPEGPYNIAAVTWASRPRIDKTPYEAHGLAWTSAPLAVSTEITGYPRVGFWASLSADDTDFVVEITDVSPRDKSSQLKSFQVTRGYLNAMRSFSRSDPQPLTPGRLYGFELELYPTSYVFPAGHRMRVTLQGSAIDPASALPADVDPMRLSVLHGPGLNSRRAHISICQNADHPAWIELPVIGTGGLG